MEQTVSSPEVMSAQTFGQLVRDGYSETVACVRRRRLATRYYLDAVTKININMQKVETACSSSNMLAVFLLAHHQLIDEAQPSAENRTRPRQGPLKSLRLLNLYGGPIESDPIHMRGLEQLIELNGGLRSLTLPGLLPQMS